MSGEFVAGVLESAVDSAEDDCEEVDTDGSLLVSAGVGVIVEPKVSIRLSASGPGELI